MSLQIEEVSSKKDLKRFIKFPFQLYKGSAAYVPPLIEFEMNTLLKEKNPSFENADARYWVVIKDGKIVGRIAAIVLDHELKEKQLARFGWIDFIDDYNVSSLLLDTAKEWIENRGANAIHGPMGFTDLDFEGALTEGFDELATQATIYNYPYYIDHYKEWGMEASVSWTEMRGGVPKEVPRRVKRAASIVTGRFKLSVKKFKKTKDLLKYANGVFEVLNASYANLYGYHALTPKQIDYYIDQYFSFVRREYICIVVNEDDKVIGFGISLPSLSTAFQKAKGSLFPFGFIHVLRSFLWGKHIDLFLIGILPEYQKMGAIALIIDDLCSTYIKKGANCVSNGPALDDNHAILNSWREFNLEPKIKRSVFLRKF
ncbi:MAG: hypothetical protein GDA51_04620 [Ekhidna sp.]|nr:hypothetical protein [Ekhidna sp.]